ncbi:ABC transporter ATP-binding protein [Nakamurella leprariae]|uniref:ABC transporter ATP-binding protein n=1 Tax=Nakamurella leprariae TaxID=2803911 RepID=UPI002E2D83E3|nr:ABC transporter ATP-binding protein [Nakamurella leprariae]
MQLGLLDGRWVHAVSDLDMDLPAGTVTLLAGESGCGKSVLASALIGLLPPTARVRGQVGLDGPDPLDLLAADDDVLATRVRGRRVGLVPQSAGTALTPTRTVGALLSEAVTTLGGAVPAADLLREVWLDPDGVADLYPHQLSGGMAHRVLLALALAGQPDVLLCDEPTAGLDPENAAHVAGLLAAQARTGRAVLLISHDIAACAPVADRVAVMVSSRVVEVGPATDVLDRPWHDYPQALWNSLPERGFRPVPGDPPPLTDLPDDCAWHRRAGGACSGVLTLEPVAPDHWVSCGRGPVGVGC